MTKWFSKSRGMTISSPYLVGGRPVCGSLKTTSGVIWWSLINGVEALRRSASDLTPMSVLPSRPDDWERVH